MLATDAVNLFVRAVSSLKKGTINLNSPLEEIVIRNCGIDLAYIDNRKDAKQLYGFDFWGKSTAGQLKRQGVDKRILYSQFQQFPDFLFKVRKEDGYIDGGLIELKDSKSGSIASFNSTIPTKYKNLEEIDVINGSNMVSKIAAIMDGSFNLILQSSPEVENLEVELSTQIPELEAFSIFHKRNGKHAVFQFRMTERLSQFL